MKSETVPRKPLNGETSNAETVNELTENLDRVAWKLQGISGLMFSAEDPPQLTTDEMAGLSFLLRQLADEILENDERILEIIHKKQLSRKEKAA